MGLDAVDSEAQSYGGNASNMEKPYVEDTKAWVRWVKNTEESSLKRSEETNTYMIHEGRAKDGGIE